MLLSPHFALAEFIPPGRSCPPAIEARLMVLCKKILEPVREALGAPITIHSGWRPSDLNEAAGGVPQSDHENGDAADFHVAAVQFRSWESNTHRAYYWIMDNLSGLYGQVILEDRRISLQDRKKLHVHVSNVTAKHPGSDDPNRDLVSYELKRYEPYGRV